LTENDDTHQDNPENSPTPPDPQPSLPNLEVDQQILDEVRRTVREDPNADTEVILQRITTLVAEVTSGPLPPPSMLRGYEEVLPGAADRIFTLMEQQSAHRQKLERISLDRNSRARDRGQHYAFILCALVIVGGFAAILTGHSVAGMAAIIIVVGGVAATFLATRQRQQRQLEERREAVPERREALPDDSRE